jgi:hypothetical protein
MVVQGHITHERLRQIFTAGESVSCEHIGNAPIETLHHAIRSGCAWLGQAVFNAQAPAHLVKLMVTRGLALTACKQPVGELLAVVGQNFCILIGQALCKALRNKWASAEVWLAQQAEYYLWLASVAVKASKALLGVNTLKLQQASNTTTD